MKTPLPKLKRSKVKVLKPKSSAYHKAKAKEYGYEKKYAETIGTGQKKAMNVRKPVAEDTNKTRRKMVMPTKKGSY